MSNKVPISYTTLAHLFIITLLTTVSYSNSFSSSFHFDDRYAIFEDMAIRDIDNVPAILKDVFSRPLLRVTFALNYYFGEIGLFGYHLTNLLLHIAVCFGVYSLSGLLFRRFVDGCCEKDSRAFSLMASLVFALHPIQTGSVTYIASRSAVLAALFYLLAVILFITGFEKKGLMKAFLNLGAFFCFLLGLGVKETVLTLPFIVPLLSFYLIRPQGKTAIWSNVNRTNIIVSGMWLLTLPVFALVKYIYVHQVIPVDTRFGPGEVLPPYQYLLTELNVMIFHYLGWLFFPVGGPHADPDIPAETSFMDMSTILAVIIIAGLLYIVIRSIKKRPIVSFAILWYFITLLPTSTLFPLADVAVERHLYLPSIGFAVIVSYFIIMAKGHLPEKVKLAPFLIVSVLLASLTIKTNLAWKSEVTLWEDAAAKSPNKARVLSNRAFAYFEAGDLERAEALYNDFLQRFPNDAAGYNNMGLIYDKKGDITSAIKYYKEAVRLRPGYWLFHMHLGDAFRRAGLINEAINEMQSAVKIEPRNPELLISFASLLAKQGEFGRVIDVANALVRLEPKNALAFSLLGIAYEGMGRKEEAYTHYKTALKLNPGWVPIIEKIKALEGS